MSNSDDFNIELGQSVRRHIEQKKSPREDGRLVALPYDSPEKDSIPVFIAEHVMRSIEKHTSGETDKEVGGVLLGGYYRSGKGAYIEITDFIEAKAAVGTDVSLTFTHETWTYFNEEQAHRGSESKIVGWYHSHPALGVFMSREDEFIHSGYFNEPWHVALVVDPICHDWGCFRWDNDSLVRTGGFYVFGNKKAAKSVREYVQQSDASRQAAPQAASAGVDRRYRGRSASNPVLWIVILLLVIAQIVTSYMLVTKKPKPERVDYYALAIEQLSYSDLSGGEFYLRQAVNADNDNKDAHRELDRLHSILSNHTIARFDNRLLDLTNFRLYTADKLADGGVRVKEKPVFDGVTQWLFGDKGYQLQAEDPAKDAFKTYKSAEDSYLVRLSRARIIARIARGKAKHVSDKVWYKKAIGHLQSEHLKKIAYGLSASEEDVSADYKKLTRKEQETVNNLRAKLVKPK